MIAPAAARLMYEWYCFCTASTGPGSTAYRLCVITTVATPMVRAVLFVSRKRSIILL